MNIKDQIDVVRRALREFLALPSLIIFLFMVLSVAAYVFERSEMTLYSPLRDFLQARIFADAEATSELLSTIAGSIITVTSITITLMLLILQQTASTMSSQVFDQFLRRRSNQIYFGFFIGLALYTLITLATVDEPFNPIFAAALAYLLTVIALYLLILLFYSTIHQMRPPVIIQAIHDHTLDARKHQLNLIHRTRRETKHEWPVNHQVFSQDYGFVTNVNLGLLANIVDESERACEIVLLVSVGSFVASNDLIAEIKLSDSNGTEQLDRTVRNSIYLERSRDPEADPSFGIAQLENIAWTSTSTAKSNPDPGLQVVYSLRDLLARWAAEEPLPDEEETLPIIYNDSVLLDLLGAFESLSVVASLSKEHQILAEILNAFSTLYYRMPKEWLTPVENAITRILQTVDEHILTRSLEVALVRLADVLADVGESHLAGRVLTTLNQTRQNGLAKLGDAG